MSGAIIAFVVLAALASSAAPLLVYSTTLALFGLLHVLRELRYVDARFGRRVRTELVVGAALLLAGVVVVRVLLIAHVLGPQGATLELMLVCSLGALALPELARRSAARFAFGVVVVGALAVGTLVSPAITLVSLAVLHNATPVAFLVDKAKPAARARTALLAVLAFVGAPALVASGLLGDMWRSLGVFSANATVLPTGPLSAHLRVYLPEAWHRATWAPDAFAAVVCAQLLHYGAVIVLMPRLLDGHDLPRLSWPAPRPLWIGSALLGAGLLVHFSSSFSEARAVYGLAAGVHAWIEVPVLLWALAGVGVSAAANPARTA